MKNKEKGEDVFISHASQDRALAAAVVALLRWALNMQADRILCTSLDGYRLPGGRDADEALREAVLSAKTLVGIVSPASGRSAYVQAELGGRWVTRKHMIPVTAGGVSPSQVRGPVGRLNALDLSTRGGVLQLISDLGTELEIEPERPPVFAENVDRVVRESKAAGSGASIAGSRRASPCVTRALRGRASMRPTGSVETAVPDWPRLSARRKRRRGKCLKSRAAPT